ncbi:hypothetical protein JSO19_03965 [Leucobacter sp. UCMA 4100]|uniref:hypothetical protein n=1 Tax=Leucobacter sp. UCMA 4100 TaxID=2810534 RepID=UPI0022EA2458|nr:hypothetical protein [Leucobacter sp. UCMA 4100]MDA3146532.1 hypothetical protein [Leucobacter sp. UCMA 4100]
MSHPIDIFSRAVAPAFEASILPQSLVQAVGSIAAQFGVIILVVLGIASLVLAGKVAALAPLGTKRLAGGTVFFTLIGIVMVAAYATLQMHDIAIDFLREGNVLP